FACIRAFYLLSRWITTNIHISCVRCIWTGYQTLLAGYWSRIGDLLRRPRSTKEVGGEMWSSLPTVAISSFGELLDLGWRFYRSSTVLSSGRRSALYELPILLDS